MINSLATWIAQPIIFAFPIYAANVIPLWIKKVPFLDVPLDFNRTWRGKRIFGDHKTIRGLVFGSLVGGLIGIVTHGSFWIGLALSVATLLGDATGAFFKRQADHPPGSKQFFHDRFFDILFPILLAFLGGFLTINWWQVVFLIIFSIFLNKIANIVWYLLKIKESPW